jgi:endoribonuclease Dicer
LVGAILVDSGYNKKMVFESIMPILEPLVTLETLVSHPVKELNELCQKRKYNMKESIKSGKKGMASIAIEVKANEISFKGSAIASDKRTAKKIASKIVLKSPKEHIL